MEFNKVAKTNACDPQKDMRAYATTTSRIFKNDVPSWKLKQRRDSAAD